MDTRDIRIRVHMGDDTIESIRWEADDAAAAGAPEGERDANAMLVAFWDPRAQETMAIGQWAKGMTTEEMGVFVAQSVMMLARTYRDAVGDREGYADLVVAAREFAEKAQAKEKGRGASS